jgi:hypothetical protein
LIRSHSSHSLQAETLITKSGLNRAAQLIPINDTYVVLSGCKVFHELTAGQIVLSDPLSSLAALLLQLGMLGKRRVLDVNDLNAWIKKQQATSVTKRTINFAA